MLKRLLPLALALSATGAAAQTTVVLYGIADGDFRVDHTAIGTLKSVGSGGEAASRWGLRGTEDLGGGLKAVFNFEQDLDLGDNSVPQGNIGPTTPSSPTSSTGSRFFGRRAIIGLNSAQFGEIRFGREYTPFYQVWSVADAFANGTVGRANNIAVGNTTRFDNSITYESPSFVGFQVKAQVRLGESTTNSTTAGSATKGGGLGDSISLTYAKGPIYAGVGYLHQRSAIDVAPAANAVRSQVASLAYDFTFVKVNALYFHTKNQTTSKLQSYEVSVAVPIQSFRVLAAAGRIDNKYAANNSTLHLNDSNYVAAGVTYALSKRTDLYAAWSKMVNQNGAAVVIADNSTSGLYTATNVPAGFNPWSAQAGMRFLF